MEFNVTSVDLYSPPVNLPLLEYWFILLLSLAHFFLRQANITYCLKVPCLVFKQIHYWSDLKSLLLTVPVSYERLVLCPEKIGQNSIEMATCWKRSLPMPRNVLP